MGRRLGGESDRRSYHKDDPRILWPWQGLTLRVVAQYGAMYYHHKCMTSRVWL